MRIRIALIGLLLFAGTAFADPTIDELRADMEKGDYRATVKKMADFVNEYKQSGCAKNYGFPVDPLKFEGGGCTSFADAAFDGTTAYESPCRTYMTSVSRGSPLRRPVVRSSSVGTPIMRCPTRPSVTLYSASWTRRTWPVTLMARSLRASRI